jgi:hypothetical protein
MQSKFQNEVIFPKKTHEIHFIASLNIFSAEILKFGLPLFWTRVRSQLFLISVVLVNFIILAIQWVLWALSPGGKPSGLQADHSPPTSAEVKKMWFYTSTPPYAFMT